MSLYANAKTTILSLRHLLEDHITHPSRPHSSHETNITLCLRAIYAQLSRVKSRQGSPPYKPSEHEAWIAFLRKHVSTWIFLAEQSVQKVWMPAQLAFGAWVEGGRQGLEDRRKNVADYLEGNGDPILS